MTLEYLIILSSFLLSLGIGGLLVRREAFFLIISLILMSMSLVIALLGFSIFWKDGSGVLAIFVILALLLVQIMTTCKIILPEKS